jgi:hypothetical protein
LIGIGPKLVSKIATNASYQEILVEFVEGVKESEAQWYSIKPLQNDIPSLANLLEVLAEKLHRACLQKRSHPILSLLLRTNNLKMNNPARLILKGSRTLLVSRSKGTNH